MAARFKIVSIDYNPANIVHTIYIVDNEMQELLYDEQFVPPTLKSINENIALYKDGQWSTITRLDRTISPKLYAKYMPEC